ncbi:DEAD/DEAH box helicase family protein [Kitasatospora sp. NPDC096140]|uniref:DEAD/DEAH box helicase family protein n=1 Tax=Kitasatospora sp. NPDC096140 TaxID=3155425 RepID=UPI00333413F5
MEPTTVTAEQEAPMANVAASRVLPLPVQRAAAGPVNPLPLHWFQKEAVAVAVRAVKAGGRAMVVAATGSGKTLIAAGCVRCIALAGGFGVLVLNGA